ncbi:MAG: hypothetical protein ABS75_31850 [Pelagibacterium sp. SCN 63-23]|nr:MAG: hypothetical protein ABS75_31850 [Pelagibacterium sp. SCN 63-23]
MFSSEALKVVVTQLRPVIERQLADAAIITGMRELVTAQGGDWSAIKALVKAQVQDEQDEAGDGKRVRKVIEKGEFTTAYADMLGMNLNEENFIREAAE